MDEAERYEFEETVKELAGYRGRHTELISVLIPADYNINNVVRQIETEKGTAENIKSKNWRETYSSYGESCAVYRDRLRCAIDHATREP